MINFTAGAPASSPPAPPPKSDDRHLARLCREGQAGQVDRFARETVRIVYLEDVRGTVSTADKIRALFGYRRALVPATPTIGPRSSIPRARRHAKGCRAFASQHAVQRSPGRGAHRLWPHRQGLQHTADIPFLRAHRRAVLPLVSGVPVFSTPRRCTTASSGARLWRERDNPLRHGHLSVGYGRAAHPYDFRSVRYMLAGAEPVKEATPGGYGRKNSVCAFSRATASPKPHRHSRSTRQCSTLRHVGGVARIEARLDPVEGIEKGAALRARPPMSCSATSTRTGSPLALSACSRR